MERPEPKFAVGQVIALKSVYFAIRRTEFIKGGWFYLFRNDGAFFSENALRPLNKKERGD